MGGSRAAPTSSKPGAAPFLPVEISHTTSSFRHRFRLLKEELTTGEGGIAGIRGFASPMSIFIVGILTSPKADETPQRACRIRPGFRHAPE